MAHCDLWATALRRADQRHEGFSFAVLNKVGYHLVSPEGEERSRIMYWGVDRPHDAGLERTELPRRYALKMARALLATESRFAWDVVQGVREGLRGNHLFSFLEQGLRLVPIH